MSRASGDRARRGNHGRALLPGHWAPPTGPCWRGGLLASSRPARSAAVVLAPATHCPAICPTGRRVPCHCACAAEDRAIRHATWRELCCRSRAIAQHNIDCGSSHSHDKTALNTWQGQDWGCPVSRACYDLHTGCSRVEAWKEKPIPVA